MITLKIPQVCVAGRTMQCRRVPHNMSNQRFHWRVKKSWDDAWKQAVWGEYYLQRHKMGKLPYPYAHITFEIRAVRMMDRDGASNSIKPLLDALKGNIIIDDSNKYIDQNVEQIKVDHYVDEGVTIKIWT